MPAYPNPYGPATAIGSGLSNISNAIFSAGRMGAMGRYGRMRTEAQDAEDQAQAQVHAARMRLLDEQTLEQKQQNATRSPEALAQYGADSANLPAHIYNGIVGMPDHHFDLEQGPSPALRYSDDDMQAARIGRQLASAFAANNAPNPEQFMKAGTQGDMRRDRSRVIAGDLSGDTLGDAQAGFEGKPRYGLENGIQYSNQVSGKATMTPVADAVVETQKSLQGKNKAQARQADASANLSTVKAKAGGFAPKAEKDGGGAGNKRASLTKQEIAQMENQLKDIVGTDEFSKIDAQSRVPFISRATELAVDPNSKFHRNPAGAMQKAVEELAPDGFEDTAGFFSSAKFSPKKKGAKGDVPAFDGDKEKRYQEWKARQGA